MPSQTAFIFFHIPKTAGLTLTNLLGRHYRNRSLFHTEIGLTSGVTWESVVERLQESQAQRKRWDFYRGHMRFGLHDYIDGPVRYITFLRDPVKRACSYYYMLYDMGVVEMPPCQLHDFDWIGLHPSLSHEMDNGQTRALAKAPLDLPFGECRREHLDAAIANLDRHFDFVGLSEQFNLSLLLLNELCGWRWRLFVPRNVRISRSQGATFSSAMKEKLRQLNALDAELYRYAAQKLETLIQIHGLTLQLELAAFNSVNAFHGKWHRLRKWVKKQLTC